MRLQGKAAIVTGAASGFGEGIARRFAAEGAQVLVADMNLGGAERVAREIGGVPMGGDVSRGADVQALVDRALAEFGGLDIVVNNAGTTHRNKPILEVTEAEFDRVYDVNVKSIFWMVQAAVPLLKRQGRGGSIINISSTAGIRPRPGLTWYNSTKGAVNTATQAMAQEFARDNIRVNAVCPVMSATGLLTEFMGGPDTPETRARFVATIPLGRMSTPADIANACVWLAEDASAFITGVLLPVDGALRVNQVVSPADAGRPLNILSIQSWVAYGHVGNASAVFPLQRLGAEVWAVNTVQFSNHTGYGAWRGQVFGAELIAELVEGIAERGALGRCDAVLSGYMGAAEIGEAVLSAAARVKAVNAGAMYCCDPVIGDVGRGIFVRPGIPEFMRDRALPEADIATPNQFELEWLTGQPVTTLDDAKAAVGALQGLGPRCVLVTSLRLEDTPEDAIDLLAGEGGAFYRVRTPLLPLSVNGAGDAIAALFLFHRLRWGEARVALSAAASSIYGLLRRTAEAGSREILTVAAQEEFVTPSRVFRAEPC